MRNFRVFVAAAALAFAGEAARATPVTGNLALAGLDTFSPTGITFVPPATVLTASGSLGVMMGSLTATFHNVTNFGAEDGQNLLTWTNGPITVTMMITSLHVITNNNNFLNVMGTAIMTETGLTATDYGYDFTSTRPDGTTSYTMDIAAVPEVSSLLLVGTGILIFTTFISIFRRRRNFNKALTEQ